MLVLGLPDCSLAVTLLFLLTVTVHGQCPVSRRSMDYCSCNYRDNNGYRVARSIVCSGLNPNTTLIFTDTRDIFVDLIIRNSTMDQVIPFMFSRVRARNFIMTHNEILSIDDNAFLGAEDYIESLDLSHNLITSLPPAIFKLLRFLKILNLSNNRLTTIYKSAFEGLSSLTYLNLGRNNIYDIRSDGFSELVNVKTLLLDGNAIGELKNDSFSGLGRLQLLHLSSNKISKISGDAFTPLTSLRSLYLPLNDLPSIPESMLRMNEYLEELSLSDNELTSIPENVFFLNKYLKSIDISFNKLNTIEKFPFKKLERLEKLNLQNNKIRSIYKNVFENLNQVQTVNLANNLIDNLEENGLAGLAVTQTVRLDNNLISIVPYGVFDAIGNVVYLNLSMNLIENFEDSNPFLANNVLKELDLSWNRIKEVPPTLFKKTRSLQKLSMAHNEITMMDPESFVNVPKLESLDLTHNRINSPDGNLFYNCPKLKTLKLSWNPLQELPRSFLVGLSGLEEVNLDHGCLTGLPDGFFTPVDDTVNATTPPELQQPVPLTNLKVAHLNSNFLQGINASQLQGPKLSTLNIQENNISMIDPRVFSLFSTLESANLSWNDLTSSIRDSFGKMRTVKVLDLRHNQIEGLNRRALEVETAFVELYLEGNPIYCDCDMAFLRVYDNLKDPDSLLCGSSNTGLDEELVVCTSTQSLGCSSWPSNHRTLCARTTQNDLEAKRDQLIQASEDYQKERMDYEEFCVIYEGMTTSGYTLLDPNFTNFSNIDLPEITKITPTPDDNYIRVEWKHEDISLVSGYRLRYTNSSNNVTHTSEVVDDRLWYVLNNTHIDENYLICVEVILLDGQSRLDERRCREVRDVLVRKVSEEDDRSGLLQLLVPIIAVAAVLLIIILIIIGVRVSLRRKRHRDKQQEAMTAEQKLGMWDFPFKPHASEELVEQTTLPYDVYSETIVDPKFRLKKLRATIRGMGKTKRVKRRKSQNRQIPSVAGSMRSINSMKSDSMNSIHSNNSLDDVDTGLFISSQGEILPPPYTESANGSIANGSVANGSVANGSVANGSLTSISIMGNGSVKSSVKSGANSMRSVKNSARGSRGSARNSRNSKNSRKGKRNSGYESDNRSGE